MQAPNIVGRAAMMRWEHYVKQGITPLPWPKLTDAQKLPWLLQAVADDCS